MEVGLQKPESLYLYQSVSQEDSVGRREAD